ncbi:rifin [Plasmodium reichenowi]|uniref:Rifin n=1 Tax=Plasmodium reichenowi TaxID=5854 RepID=A0A060RQ50_PLARE|nr:rifin [Plasmodium reichenowi]
MKVHYFNILMFSLPLNVLAYNKNKPPITQNTKANRSLCECELYAPAIYDNDLEMKKVMQQFEDRTSQRFHEYDDRMKTTRQKCKERCDKEIQKIILKDKLEKQMEEQLTTLETKVDTDDIPTCICEKSLADKVEKGCLRCTQNLGGIVAPSTGVLAGIGEAAISVLKPAALKAAARYAMKEGAAQGVIEGNAHAMNMVTHFLQKWGVDELIPSIYKSFVTKNRYTELANIGESIISKHSANCAMSQSGSPVNPTMCQKVGFKIGTHAENLQTPHPTRYFVGEKIKGLALKADEAAAEVAKDAAKKVTAEITEKETNLINTIYGTWDTAITASIIAIVVIVLIMVIIYLILRYRRKKKMKKKLQYIKLLEE